MEFRILGPLEVCDASGALVLGGSKPRAILAVLLLNANRPLSAERLAQAVWDEEIPAAAARTVHVYISRLRKALDRQERIATGSAGYRLRIEAGELDAERFELGLAAAQRTLEEGAPGRAAVLLDEALALWRGPALAEFDFEGSIRAEIARLHEQRLVAVSLRAEAALAIGRPELVVGELAQFAAEHPMHEQLAAKLMLALYRSGRQSEALEVYRDIRRVLVEAAGIEPGSELQRLHQAVLNQDASLGLEPLDTASTRRIEHPDITAQDSERALAAGKHARHGAVPLPPNRTIGRAREIQVVAERLRAGSVRLLTLTGPGGVGKTRLALDAARSVAADFPDGARFVSLAAVQRAQDVPAAFVSALAVIPLAGESAERAVERFLAAKQLLLVVDNCEHLPGAAPFIASLATACPGVRMLATSREALAVQPEQRHPVPPLALPDAETDNNFQALAGVDAIALFCERARAHDPDFELDDGTAPAVAAICRRLDGLPLALELAAARCGLLSPREIVVRLQLTLDTLGTGARDAPARQQTLRATVDWSHRLLDGDEKACFARFAVFCGDTTVQAAEAITGASLDTLDRLVAKSLLVRRRDTRGVTWLGMLETVRAYASERSAALADSDSVRDRHFEYFLALARRHGAPPALDGPNRVEHLGRLDGEVENFRGALRWATERQAWWRVLQLSVALVDYWMRRDRYLEAIEWIVPGLRNSDASRDPARHARAICKSCWPHWALGHREEILALVAEAHTIAPTMADPVIRAEVLYSCAALWSIYGRAGLAASVAEEALTCAKASRDVWTIAMAAWARALVAGRGAGDAHDLRERVEEAAPLLEEAGNLYHLALLFANAASCALRRAFDADAALYLKRAVPLVRQIDQPFISMMLREKVGLAALFSHDTHAARDAFREELALSHELVASHITSQALTGLASVAAADNQPVRAARLAGAATTHRRAANDDAITARLQANFLKPARIRIGTRAWDQAVREGAALDLNSAIAYALGDARPEPRHLVDQLLAAGQHH